MGCVYSPRLSPIPVCMLHCLLAPVAIRLSTCTTVNMIGDLQITACTVVLAKWQAWDLISLCNGMLVGFVSITAGCHVLEPWAAMLCGATAGCMFDIICHVLLKLRIDDPLCAYPMHGFCGMWGVLFVGLLAKKVRCDPCMLDGRRHGCVLRSSWHCCC